LLLETKKKKKKACKENGMGRIDRGSSQKIGSQESKKQGRKHYVQAAGQGLNENLFVGTGALHGLVETAGIGLERVPAQGLEQVTKVARGLRVDDIHELLLVGGPPAGMRLTIDELVHQIGNREGKVCCEHGMLRLGVN
jgi:hypothetical protein